MQHTKLKKRIPNLVAGVAFACLAIYLAPSAWAYLFTALSVVAAAYSDELVQFFAIELRDEIKMSDSVEIEVQDPSGNLKSRHSSQ